ncbi:hypothetical protein RJ55_07950 [Drechmeria coniospora]|nr:hypothetical protein RJ55_07950 [Drechmeria coniospora]
MPIQIDADNDPREMMDNTAGLMSSGQTGISSEDMNSDPDEADIDEHMGPHGFVHHQSVRAGPQIVNHHDPDITTVLDRFYEMIEGFGQPQTVTHQGSPSHDGQVPPSRPHIWPQVHRTTFTSGSFGGGAASVTIFSSPIQTGVAEHAHDAHAGDPFQSIFSSVIRELGPPTGGQMGGPAPNFARGLQEIMSLFNPANAVAGDAVYSQEALDRIITQLMEATPRSNGAPPASNEALESLDRRPVDESMVKGECESQCIICLEIVNVGDMAVFLRCKHWFHEDCVVSWLREHNTCPICRTAIETHGDGVNNNALPGGVGGRFVAGDSGPRAQGELWLVHKTGRRIAQCTRRRCISNDYWTRFRPT